MSSELGATLTELAATSVDSGPPLLDCCRSQTRVDTGPTSAEAVPKLGQLCRNRPQQFGRSGPNVGRTSGEIGHGQRDNCHEAGRPMRSWPIVAKRTEDGNRVYTCCGRLVATPPAEVDGEHSGPNVGA